MREMKDSGVEWIGEIPKDWVRTSMINVLCSRICDGPHETPEITDGGIPFISVDSLDDTKNVNLDVAKKSISEELYQEYYRKAPLEEGDILFSKAATIGKTAIVDNRKFMVWSPLAIIKVDRDKCDNLYIYYLLNCHELIKYVSFLGGYNTQINVGMRALEKAQIPVPSLGEQKRIADYLDTKCSQIDSIIEKQQAIIEKLKEYKLSVITEAVTKGLNPDAEMKDSGIKEVGLIPIDFVPTKIKYICNTQGRIGFKGYTTADLVDENEGAYTLGASHLNNGIIDLSSPVYISWEKYYESPEIMVNMDDLLIVQRGSTIGKVAIVDKDYGPTTINPSLVLINDIRINNKYLLYALSARYIAEYINLIGNTTAIPMISQKQINDLVVILPKENMQLEIVYYLDKKCVQVDSMVEKKNRIVEKLQEYKKSLIYELVTGKKEV